MHDVIIARATKVRETTCDGERTGIILGNAQRRTTNLHGRREAGIKIEIVDVGNAPA